MNDADSEAHQPTRVDDLRWSVDFLEELAKFPYDSELQISEIRWAFVRAHKRDGTKRDITAKEAARMYVYREHGHPDPDIHKEMGMLLFEFSGMTLTNEEREKYIEGPEITEIFQRIAESDGEYNYDHPEIAQTTWKYTRPDFNSSNPRRNPKPKLIQGVREYSKHLSQLTKILTEQKVIQEMELKEYSDFRRLLEGRVGEIRFLGPSKGRRYSHENSLRRLHPQILAQLAVIILEKHGNPMKWSELTRVLSTAALSFHQARSKTRSDSVSDPPGVSMHHTVCIPRPDGAIYLDTSPEQTKFYAGNDNFTIDQINEWCGNVYTQDWFRNSAVTIQKAMTKGGMVLKGEKKGEWVHRNSPQHRVIKPIDSLNELEDSISEYIKKHKDSEGALDLLRNWMMLKQGELSKSIEGDNKSI